MSNPGHQHVKCTDVPIGDYLNETLSSTQRVVVEDHLSRCTACRERIDQCAADDVWWLAAGQYLKPDEWDSGIDVSTTKSTANCEQQDTAQSARDIALRQVREWLDPTDDPCMLGRFGGYEIVGIVGQGGMGVVLKGFETALNRYVAIKVLSPHLATSGTARRRFAREAQAAAAVLHENVIAIHRVDEAGHLPYLVMPYVSDTPLQKRIDDEGPLPLSAILRIGGQIASGLAAAHAQGLVHRDIKPANILLQHGVERVTITDFGLARAADDCSVTKTGVIAGTPHYMSPEQAQGEPIDGRSDLFSLGSVIYIMSTGRVPFRSETAYGILRRISDVAPHPIRDINPDIPVWLCRLVDRLHAKQPDNRYQSAEHVAELLRICLAHVQTPNSPLPLDLQSGFVRRKRMLLVSSLMVGLGLLIGVVWRQGRVAADPNRVMQPQHSSLDELNDAAVNLDWTDSTEPTVDEVYQASAELLETTADSSDLIDADQPE